MIVKRIMTRIYVHEMDAAIRFYEQLMNDKCGIRFAYQQANLEIAQVSSILIIAGTDEALKPFRTTSATFAVDSVAEFKAFLLANGGSVVRDIQAVPTGLNMTMQHPDGSMVEYVEFLSKEY
jgi:predicted enzyme related to lactoylglutathione lyase